MSYDKNIEMNKIQSLNTPRARFEYYRDIVSTRFLTDSEKTELIHTMSDKYPSFIFEPIFNNSLYSLWERALQNELIKLGQLQTTQARTTSSSIIMALIDKYSACQDSAYCPFFSSEHASNLAILTYYPELFNDLLNSIEKLDKDKITLIYEKILYGMSVRHTQSEDEQKHMDHILDVLHRLSPKLSVESILEDKLINEVLFATHPTYHNFLNRVYLLFKRQEKFDTSALMKKIFLKCELNNAGDNSLLPIHNLHPEIQLQMLHDIKNNHFFDDSLSIHPVSDYYRLIKGFNLFTNFFCQTAPVCSLVCQYFTKLDINKKLDILCHESEVVLKAVPYWDYQVDDVDPISYDLETVKYTPLKKIVETNSEAIPELIKCIEQLPLSYQAKIWKQEAAYMAKYPGEIKSSFYVFKLKEKVEQFDKKQWRDPAYQKAYTEANSLYETLIKDRDDNQCKNWIRLIEKAKQDTSLTHHRGMKDIFIGLLLFPYSLYKLYKGNFFKEPFTRTDTASILDELCHLASNA
jgi:hypothetical protein